MSTSWAFWVWPFFIIPIERGFRLVVLMLRIFSSLCSKILSAKISLLSSLWPLPENKKQDMKSFEIDWQCFLLSYQLKKGIMKRFMGFDLLKKGSKGLEFQFLMQVLGSIIHQRGKRFMGDPLLLDVCLSFGEDVERWDLWWSWKSNLRLFSSECFVVVIVGGIRAFDYSRLVLE